MSAEAAALAHLGISLAGRYRIERELGVGGMATVYLAHDVRHDRDVAMKVLHSKLGAALGGERFLSEIRTTARLQHPHILPLLDSGDADGLLYYVMPLVTGESLRTRLERERQLPIAEALRIARDVASALHYAHGQGVIHRDIKPENVLLQDGQVLVVDFGIALAVLPTGEERITLSGQAVGTPHYMSPEQAMGDDTVDAKSDIYALGAVLFEMLTGEPPFTGVTAQAVIARLITERAPPPSRRRDRVSPEIDHAVLIALEKLPADRFATAAQFAEALTDPASPTWASRWMSRSARHRAASTSRNWRAARLVAGGSIMVAIVSVGIAAWAWDGWQRSEVRPMVRFDIPVGSGVQVTRLAASPDGRQIAYIAESASVSRLYIRTLDAAARLVDGTDEPTSDGLAFSPDGKWLAFVAGDKLTRVPTGGGAPSPITAVRSAGKGIAWPTDGTIVLGPRSIRGRGLVLVSVSSGEVRPLTHPDTGARGEVHVAPFALPGGNHILLWTQGPGGIEDDFIAVAALATGKVTRLPIAGAPIGVVSGRLIFRDLRTQSLMGVPFDLVSLRVLGVPARVAEPVEEAAVSTAGVLVTRSRTMSQLLWVGADGAQGTLLEQAGAYRDPRLSPDEKRIALSVLGQAGTEVVIHEIATGTSSRLSPDGRRPEWTPDGARVLYRAFRARTGLAWEPSDFSGSTEPVAVASDVHDAAITEGVVSPDGRTLLYVLDGDLFTLPLDGDIRGRHAKPRPFQISSAYNCMPRFSPDGRWVAFQSNISGQEEIYVLPFPGPGGRRQVSARGGREPVWAPDGRLYYRQGQKMMAVTMALVPTFAVVSRAVMFEGDYLADGNHPQYDVARDGRFLMLRPDGAPRAISVVLDWRPGR